MKKINSEKIIATNKKAYHDFAISEEYEAGISLLGAEVKSIRQGKVSLKESYIRIKDGEAVIDNMHIAEFKEAAGQKIDVKRGRRLLLHKREISKIAGKVSQKGLTVVPLKIYLKHGKIKIQIGLAKGKTLYDKRRTIAEKTSNREIEKAFRQSQKK